NRNDASERPYYYSLYRRYRIVPRVLDPLRSCSLFHNPGHFEVFDEPYPYLYELLLVLILLLTVIFNIGLFLYGMCGFTRRKKEYVLFLFAYHFVIVIPFYLSGFYLYLAAIQPGTSQLSSYAMLMFTEALNEVRFNTLTERTLTAINDLQDRFCCCGLNGPADYGWEFEKEKSPQDETVASPYITCGAVRSVHGQRLHSPKATPILRIQTTTQAMPIVEGNLCIFDSGVWNRSMRDSNISLSCPFDKGCQHHEFPGCLKRIPQRKRLFIIVTSSIGIACAVGSLLITPFVYASFEHDRRVARARYIRTWRAQMDLELEHERKDELEEDTISEKAEQKSAISKASEQKQNARLTKDMEGLGKGGSGRTSAGRGASNRWKKTSGQKPISLATTVSARTSNSSEEEDPTASPSQVNEPLLGGRVSHTIRN
ncbi:hypothetical protein V3C99_014951, partial [Haemonchus contortus]